MRRAKKIGVLIAAAMIGLGRAAYAQDPMAGVAEQLSAYQIPDLGAAFPAATNESRDPRFAVYRWEMNGLQVFQINDANGQVLYSFTLGKKAHPLPFGKYAATAALVGAGDEQAIAVEAAGKCPCSSTTVYDDGSTRVVLILDSEGNVIQTITIRYTLPQ